MQALGYGEVEEVRVGKFMELRLGELPEAEARSRLAEMCEKLLANPLIEDYRVEVERAR
ncbi:MAG: phosphoribosylformylglycinamidine synthase subunit PurS [Deltaproteobacteria bacterium]|nr:phosphoribosylformylglycinamidine synthase subunit PurS [Deltaproteobacteria bacterium]